MKVVYAVLKVHHLQKRECSSLAQSVEHAAVNRRVVGSSPTGGAFFKRRDRREENKAPWSSGQDIALSRR